MSKFFVSFVCFFVFIASAYADVSTSAASAETLEKAQAEVALTSKAVEQASAWVNVAGANLDIANKALAKKPKSSKAKKEVAAAQKELESATAFKAKKEMALKEELLEKTVIEKFLSDAETKKKEAAANRVTIYPEEKYQIFSDEFDSFEKVDAFNLFNDPFEFNHKAVVLDAKFDEMISPDKAKFTIWRNFGNMHLIVSNIPKDFVIPKDKTLLLAGDITGFKKEVVSNDLIVIALLKLKSVFICNDARCHGKAL